MSLCNYPIFDNQANMDFALSCMGVFEYSETSPEVHIQWTNTNLPNAITEDLFSPNHFVPLLDPEMSRSEMQRIFHDAVLQFRKATDLVRGIKECTNKKNLQDEFISLPVNLKAQLMKKMKSHHCLMSQNMNPVLKMMWYHNDLLRYQDMKVLTPCLLKMKALVCKVF